MSRDFSHDGDHGDEETTRLSPADVRVRVPTEKGFSYSKDLAEKELSRVLRTWRDKIENAKRILADDADLVLLQETRVTLEICMNDVAEAYDKLRNLVVDKDEAKVLSGRYQLWLKMYENNFTTVNQRIGVAGSTTRSSHTSLSSSSSRKARMLLKEARFEN